MAVIGNLRVNLGLNSAEFDTGLDKAKGKTDSFVSGITKSLGGVAAAFAAAFSVRAMGQMADAWSDMNSRLKNATGSMEAGAAAMDRLQDIARRSYSPISQTTEAFLRQTSTLSALGVSTDRQLDLTETLNNALVISATRGDKAASVMDAWGKAMATGSLRGDNLNAVITGSDRLAKALADSMGINVNELRKYGEQGKITRDVMIGVTSQMEKLREEAADMPATIADGQTILGDSLLQLVGRVDQAVGASGGLAEVMVGVGDTITALTPAIVDLAVSVSNGLGGALTALAPVAGIAIAALAGFAAPALLASIGSLTVAIGTGLVAAIRAVGVAMMANPLGVLIGAIASVLAAVFIFRDTIKDVFGIDVVAVVADAANNIIRAFVGAFNGIKKTFGLLPAALGDLMVQGANAVIRAVRSMIRGVQEEFNKFFKGIDGGLAAIGLPGTGFGIDLLEIEGGDVANPWADKAKEVGDAFAQSFKDVESTNFVGALTSAITGLGADADATNEKLTGLNDTLTNTGTAAGGAGGAIKDKLAAALEAMRNALMTEEQAELASYEKRLAQIEEFYNRGLIQKAEYDAMMEAAHQQHADKMSEITRKQVEQDARIRGQMVGHTTSILGSLSTIMENFGDDNLAASKAFAVAAAIVNTAEGITKALAQGGFLGFAGAAAVAAAGVAQISTIMTARKGGSSRPTVGASAPSISQGAAAKPSQAVSISLQGDFHPTQQVEELIGKLIDMQSDGYQIILERP